MKTRVRIELQSDKILPNWAVTHYLQQTEINYLRLVTTQEICDYASRGFNLNNLVVATESAEIFLKERVSISSFKGRIELTEKADSASKFWNIIGRNSRPMVFVSNNSNSDYTPLYDFLESEALVIRRLEINSPFSASLEGMASALPDLIYAREREQRARDEWRNNQLGQAARNIRDIASASEIINRQNSHPGLLVYANHILEQLL